jgi:hypothetical protein
VAGKEARGRADTWQDLVHQRLSCRRCLVWINGQSHKSRVHPPTFRRPIHGPRKFIGTLSPNRTVAD